jgi:hypothetical protein
MLRKLFAICMCFGFAISLAEAAEDSASRPNISAATIVDRNVAARGGLQAWRSVQTMSMEGKLGAGGNQRTAIPVPSPDKKVIKQALPSRPAEEAQLPFLMEMKRSRKMRLELQFNGQTAIQVFDGTEGWKLRPFLNRRVVEQFTPEEIKAASRQTDLDGPLVDYVAKGTQVELEGIEKVEDRNTYKLKLKTRTGETTHVWIDAQSFLEAKIEGQPRRLDGTDHPVEVYYRDYRPVNGLQIPFILETKVLPVSKTALGPRDTPVPPEKIVIDKVTINPKLEDSLFAKPEAGVKGNTK